jgi:tetratricopeptide (TPR) repeat protein
MKIGHLLLVACVLGYAASCFAAATVESEALFQEANKQYRAGKFEEAAVLYDKIEDKGSVVYYNLGNCYYQQGQAGKALLNWRRAEQFGHVWERRELLDNIMFLHKQLGKSVLVGRVARFMYRMRLFLTRGPLLVFQVVDFSEFFFGVRKRNFI